jgi:hypothetical protein
MNSTVPGAPAGATCAVIVTSCPKTEDDGEMFNVVEVEVCAHRIPAQRKTTQAATNIRDITINLSYP